VETTPAQEFELRIATILPYKPGEIMAAAVLNTNVAEQKVIRVAATGRIPDRLDLYPTSMAYSRPQNTASERDYVSMYFWLNNYGASLVQVNQATVNDPGLTALVEERAPGKNYRIEVRVPINQGIPAEGRTLTVKTNDPEKPVLTARILPQIAPPVQTAKNTTTQPARTPPKPAESMLNQPAPTFSLKTTENRSLATDDLKGKITVLNFISTTCPWCRKQMPEVEKIRAVYQEKGVRFVNVVNPMKRVDKNNAGQVYSNTELVEALKPMNSNLEVAPDHGMQAGRAFNATSYPSLFVIGKDAKIAAVDIGFNKVGQIAGQLDALLAGKPVPSASQPH
jgi:thiol-disulfide isomerase/thioredoxin